MPHKTGKFLLDCIKVESENDFIALLQSHNDLDWKLLSGGMFRVFLPIYLRAKGLSLSLPIPAKIEDELKLRYVKSASENKTIENAVAELAKEFNKAKVTLLFLKGAALLATLYRNEIAVRHMTDIDVLAEKNDLPVAEAIIRNLGYEENYERLSHSLKKNVSRHSHNFHYVYYRGNIKLELHWAVNRNASTGVTKKIFASYRKVSMQNVGINVLSPAASLYISCNNFFRGFSISFMFLLKNFKNPPKNDRESMGCSILFFIYEARKMVQYYGKDIAWDDFIFLAREDHNEYAVYALLLLVKKTTGLNLPKKVLNEIDKDVFALLYGFLSKWASRYDIEKLIKLYFRINNLRAKIMNISFYIKGRKRL